MGCAALAVGSNAAELWELCAISAARIIALSCIPCSLTALHTGMGGPQEGPQEQNWYLILYKLNIVAMINRSTVP